MGYWKKLSLTSRHDRPAPGLLVALRKIPSKENATFYKEEKYDIGRFEVDKDTGRKFWWHGRVGTEDPIRMKKHYEIYWCPVAEFDYPLG